MKLLLDENLSRRIVPFLQQAYPGSTQVCLIGLERASDREIWDYAKRHDFVLVTRDADFYEMCLVYGQPPKIIWLKLNNPGKKAVLGALLKHRSAIEMALTENDAACIEVY